MKKITDNLISILITHFNRIESLEKCLKAFEKIDFSNFKIEIVVSDDGSEIKIQEQLKALKIDTLVLSERNEGLASNLNKGINACKGNYILYCQEDFLPQVELSSYMPQIVETLDSGKAEMIRLQANYVFPKLLPLSEEIKLIPKFSWKNYYYNTFQYSDNPFITTRSFFDKYGYFLENTCGAYGENEYAIRIMNSNAKIAIVNKYPFKAIKEVASVMDMQQKKRKRKFLRKIGIHKFIRASRLHLEYIFYNRKKRKLLTIENKRKV